MTLRARLGDGVIEALTHYDFPGNIRELEHMLEQAVAMVQNGVITTDDLLPPPSTPAPQAGGAISGLSSLADVVDAAERSAIEGALREADGSRERVAELLAISPTTLWRKMTRLGITFDSKGG